MAASDVTCGGGRRWAAAEQKWCRRPGVAPQGRPARLGQWGGDRRRVHRGPLGPGGGRPTCSEWQQRGGRQHALEKNLSADTIGGTGERNRVPGMNFLNSSGPTIHLSVNSQI
jgi:hypothetical protein